MLSMGETMSTSKALRPRGGATVNVVDSKMSIFNLELVGKDCLIL